MALTMYRSSVPVLIANLQNLSDILRKAERHAKQKGIDPAVLVNARLFPDMFPLSRQVQIATDMAKGGAGRLAGIEIPSFPDTESNFPELQERIRKTVSFLKTIKPAQIDGAETREIRLQLPIGSVSFDGETYLQRWVLPNVFFHASTAYNILRHNGVELGKRDFLGRAVAARIVAAAPAPKRGAAPRKKKRS